MIEAWNSDVEVALFVLFLHPNTHRIHVWYIC